MKRLMLLLLVLVLSIAVAPAQKVLSVHGGSDSIAVACDSNWCGNVYTFNVTGARGYVWVENLGSAGDLLVGQDKDTTALVGAFGPALRVKAGDDKICPLNCKALRFRAARKGTTVPFRFSASPQ